MLVPALLSACSAIKLGYNQAPSLAYWWMDSYLDFNEQQSPKVRDELARLVAWHRSSELPKVASLLKKAQAMVPNNLSAAQSCALYDEAKGLYETIVDKALPAAAQIAPTLTAEQIVHLQAKQQKMNDEYARDYLRGDANERNAKRLKNAVQRSEMLYGKLQEAQIAAIKTALEKSSFNPALGLKERERRHSQAREMLTKMARDKPNDAATQAVLRSYAQNSLDSPDPVYRAYAQTMLKESCESFATLHASTTPEQRAKAAQTLKDYESDIRLLASQK